MSVNAVFAPEAASAALRVKSLLREDSLVLPLFTDAHLNTLGEPAAVALIEALEALSAAFTDAGIRPDAVLALGDNPDMLGRKHHASNDEIAALIGGLLDRAAAPWSCPMFALNGNHDGIGTDFFSRALWSRITRGKYGSTRDPWFAVDFDEKRVRLVCLSLPSGSDLEAEHPTPLWEYGKEQLRWLAGEALNTPYPVLLAGHVPFYYEFLRNDGRMLGVWTGDRAAQTPIRNLCGGIADRKEAEAILNAFHSHAPYRNEALGIRMPASDPGCRLLAMLSGHMHADGIYASGETADSGVNTLPCAQAVTEGANPGVNLPHPWPETGPVPTIDTAVLSPGAGTLTLVRFGFGEDRSVRV